MHINSRNSHSLYLREIARGPSKYRLIYFPYAGAGATSAYRFSKAISPICSLLAVQLPGRENRLSEPFVNDPRLVCESIAEALMEFSGDQLIFWGHSLGSLIALETVRLLEKRGEPRPSYLIVSGEASPHDLQQIKSQLHLLSDEDFLSHLKTYGGIPDLVMDHPEFRKVFLPILRNDCYLLESCRHTSLESISTDLTVFTGDCDLAVPLAAATNWSSMTTGKFQFHSLPGDHFFIMDSNSGFIPLLVNLLKKITS